MTPPQTRARRLAARRLLATALAALPLASVVACSGSSSQSLPPTTGILIRAETLTAGHGCGKSTTQLFKYAVVVFGYDGSGDERDPASYTRPITSNLFDCFTDGAFISLPATASNATFRLEVYAYNESAYTASRTAIDGAGTSTSVWHTTEPTWTTECTATQQEKVQALASCNTLAPGLSGLGGTVGVTQITLATARFALPDGRAATCATAESADAGVDASDASDNGTDSGPDGFDALGDAAVPADAGEPLTFVKVRVRPRVNATVAGPSVDVACPAAYLAEVPAEPTRYELEVALLDEAGALVEAGAQTVCTVTSRPGTTSSAVCP